MVLPHCMLPQKLRAKVPPHTPIPRLLLMGILSQELHISILRSTEEIKSRQTHILSLLLLYSVCHEQILKDKKDAKIRELEARVSDLELEKVKLVNAGSERLRAVKDIKQERDQLLNEVKTSRTELNSLSGMSFQCTLENAVKSTMGTRAVMKEEYLISCDRHREPCCFLHVTSHGSPSRASVS